MGELAAFAARGMLGLLLGASAEVIAVNPAGAALPDAVLDGLSPPGPHAILVVTLPEMPRLPEAATLRAAFGLTPAEARVALALAGGADAKAIAAASGTSADTVRLQVKAVLAKTGMPRQAALVALLHRMAGPIPSGR
jgi:DNA-binding CsgD family transcriptional regulator